MVYVTCIETFRDNHGRIIGYNIQDMNGNVKDIRACELKKEIKNDHITVNNLTLTKDNKLISNKDYNQIALEYAEKYGIITYKVKDNYMIYNQNYKNSEFIGKWVEKPYTMQRKVNLETMQTDSIKLKRVQKDGWDNV